MSEDAPIVITVEGKTEEIFIKKVLGEYLALKQISVIPSQISKPGQKGGDGAIPYILLEYPQWMRGLLSRLWWPIPPDMNYLSIHSCCPLCV